MAKLIRNVIIDSVGYGPGYGNASDVPAAVAAKITNPLAWDEAPKVEEPAPKAKPARKATAKPEPQAKPADTALDAILGNDT